MFRVKICGITNYDDARAAVDAGADALGFNFYRGSKRFIEPTETRSIIDRLPASILKVGVFVNSTADEINGAVDESGVECVQLHGDEPPEIVEQISTRVPIVRAHRCGSSGLQPLSVYLERCAEVRRKPAAVLLDSDAGSAFGGTGCTIDWSSLADARHAIGDIPLILAGGLSPANVAQAIAVVKPDGVDVASGVEHAPGLKDRDLVSSFVEEARRALGRIYRL